MSADERPTPETDQVSVWPAYFAEDEAVVDAYFARSLERRLAAAKEHLAAQIAMAPIVSRVTASELDTYKAELAALRRENKQLKEDLNAARQKNAR